MESGSVLTQVKSPMFTATVCVREHRQDLFDYLVAQGWLWMLDYRGELDPIVGSAAAEACYMKHLQRLWANRTTGETAPTAPGGQLVRTLCFSQLRTVVKAQFSGAAATSDQERASDREPNDPAS